MVRAFLLSQFPDVANAIGDVTLAIDNVGKVTTSVPGTLSFAVDEERLHVGLLNPNVVALLAPRKLSIPDETQPKPIVYLEDPRAVFFEIHNASSERHSRRQTRISPSTRVAASAVVDPVDVVIGRGCRIEDGVTIQGPAVIGDDCVIRAGARIGVEGIRIVETRDSRILRVKHLGRVILEDAVEVGPNSVISRAVLADDETRVGRGTSIGPLCHVAHGAKIGSGNQIHSHSEFCGSSETGVNGYFGPGTRVYDSVRVGSNVHVSLAAQVLTDLGDSTRQIGPRVFTDMDRFHP